MNPNADPEQPALLDLLKASLWKQQAEADPEQEAAPKRRKANPEPNAEA